MENILNLSFDGAGEVRELFSKAGANNNGDRVKITLEADITELGEEGAMLVPDTIASVSMVKEAEPANEVDTPPGSSPSGDEVPGMVLVMDKKKK